MPYYTTGLIDNTSAADIRPSATLAIAISNEDTSTAAIQIEGFFQKGSAQEKFVEDFFTLAAGTVSLRNYFIQFEVVEFKFFVNSLFVEVSAWKKEREGALTSDHPISIEEIVQDNQKSWKGNTKCTS